MRRFTILFLAAIALSSCKTVQYQPSQVLNRNNDIAALRERIDQAIANDVDLLAPGHFDKAKRIFDEAMDEAQRSKDPEAGLLKANKGLKVIGDAEVSADQARDIMETALAKRNQALALNADILYESDFNDLDRELRSASRAIEKGDRTQGIKQNVELAKSYSKLELLALKSSLSEPAERAYKAAKDAHARRLAPITLANAKRELEMAREVIDMERANYDKAQYHAERARSQAMRALYISELLTEFKEENFSEEQIVLWYQEQLHNIHRPLPTDLHFDVVNKMVVEGFSEEVESLYKNLKQAELRAVVSEKKIAMLSEKIANTVGDERDRALFEQANLEENFRDIGTLFSEDEAEVVRKGNDIIIRCYGFDFPVGKATLLPRNFSLLHKLVSSIVKFPRALIEVQGHTDSTGSRNANMQLSIKRAKNIADFLIRVASIEPSRVKSIGMGEERPMAPNDNKADRAKNRRIDVVIKTGI